MEVRIINTQKNELFMGIFQHLKTFTEFANFQFMKEQLYIQGLDSAHVSIFEISIPAAWFDEYKLSGDTAVCLGINTSIFFKILTGREKTQEMKILYNAGTVQSASELLNTPVSEVDDKITVYFTNGKDKNEFDRYFELPLVDITMDVMEIPEIEYQAEFSLSSVKMAAIVGQMKLFGDTMDIVCSEEKIVIISDSDKNGKMVVDIDINELTSYAIEEGETVKLSYSLSYMGNITAFNKLAKEIDLCVTAEYPMKVTYTLGEDAYVRFYLAPKITDSD